MGQALVQLLWRHKKTETLGVVLRKVLDATAGVGAPEMTFTASDSTATVVSAVARAVKRHAELAAFAGEAPMFGVGPPVSTLTFRTTTVPSDIVLSLADGVPRSFPFVAVRVALDWDDATGLRVEVTDDWWISGRNRATILGYRADVSDGAKRLPPAPSAVAAVQAVFGKPKSTVQIPIVVDESAPWRPELTAIARRFREELAAKVAASWLPHALPAWPTGSVQEASGPMKPLLDSALGSRGYVGKGGGGLFTYDRRTAAHHVVRILIDVGSYTRKYTGSLSVVGPEFRVGLPLLVGPPMVAIDGPDGWRRIVENLEVVLDHVESTFVPAVETLVPAAPPWFEMPV